jgi:type IV pilus assembly protein PilV
MTDAIHMTRIIPSRQHGLTLIEVLIAVLVLSIGLLGLAGLQATSLQFNHSANLRSQATNLAYEMTDRMRANREAALNGQYNLAVGGTPTAGTVPGDDLAAWRESLSDRLPSGTGSVEVDANGIATVVVQWDDSRGAEAALEFTLTTRL